VVDKKYNQRSLKRTTSSWRRRWWIQFILTASVWYDTIQYTWDWDKSKWGHWLFGGRVLIDEKSGQQNLRSIFNQTHHFVLRCLEAFVQKCCGGKFGWSVLVDSSPKLIFGTLRLRYSKTLTTNQLCRHDEGEKTVRGYISSSSLQLTNTWFKWTLLVLLWLLVSLYPRQCFEKVFHFWWAKSFVDTPCVAWLYSLDKFSLGLYSSRDIASATVLCVPFMYTISGAYSSNSNLHRLTKAKIWSIKFNC
jgi:hypothetical protein